MNVLHLISETIYAYKGVYYDKRTPVIVYAPGRVGSMSLIRSLREAKIFSFKVESFNTEQRGATKFVKRHIIQAGRNAQLITLVRDPMLIMCSYFFSKCSKGWLPGGAAALEQGDVATLSNIFINSVLKTKRLDEHLFWFENEFKTNIGFDVFKFPFDTNENYLVILDRKYPTLILRTELADSIKSREINNFLGREGVILVKNNSQAEKQNADLYEEFKNELSIPSEILEKIYSSKYSTHFFSKTEIEVLKKKWGENSI